MRRVIIIIALILAAIYVGLQIAVYVIQGPEIPQGETDIRFTEVPVEWSHKADLDADLPFAAYAAIDVDGDQVDEIFVGGGGANQEDTILKFQNGVFAPMDVTGLTKTTMQATFGAASIDATGDGRVDLFVAREDGVYFYVNQGGARFEGGPINVTLAENTSPLSIALAVRRRLYPADCHECDACDCLWLGSSDRRYDTAAGPGHRSVSQLI